MKRLVISLALLLLPFLLPLHALAQETPPSTSQAGQAGFVEHLSGAIAIQITGAKSDGSSDQFTDLESSSPMSLAPYLAGRLNEDGEKAGLLPTGGHIIAMMYEDSAMPSSKEYIADILDSVGVPSVSSAYAQGTGYTAMTPFLPIWKVFRNLAYSLYIIIFIVIGIMIMLRTKVNAQTVISIQSALPNLLITLILITFSYAIVGFMIDLMYFLIYFVVYLASSADLITTPTLAINRLLNYSAWGVLFEGRNSIVSAAALAIGDVLSGLGTGGLELAGTIISWLTPAYLVVAVYLAITMLKLMFALVKSYIMLLVQLITAPVQILFNALPGSKAFGEWLKKTASYLIPFPVAALMFIFAAVLVGDPTEATIFKGDGANPFGVNPAAIAAPTDQIWLPPFTLTGSVDFGSRDILVLIGFFVFTMTPAAVKMAQEWMQVKESPYASEAVGGFAGVFAAPLKGAYGMIERRKQLEEQRKIYEKAVGGAQQGQATRVLS